MHDRTSALILALTLKGRHGRGPVPAVRLIVPDERGRVLIMRCRHGGETGGRWCLPGGRIYYGETAALAAERKLQAMASLRAVSSRFLFFLEDLPLARRKTHWLIFYFEYTLAGGIPRQMEAEDFAWIHPADLAAYEFVFRCDKGILRYWQEIRNCPSWQPYEPSAGAIRQE